MTIKFLLIVVFGIIQYVSGQQPKSPCVKPGTMCSDCNNQAMCVDNGNGGFIQTENQCPAGSTCINSQCVVGAKCNYRNFTCTDEGTFPDPYNCRTYHICMINVAADNYLSLTFTCPRSGSYDSQTSTCGYPLSSSACIDGPVPRCTAPLQIGVLPSNPSIYFLCIDDGTTLAAELYKCKGGATFDASKISCVDPPVVKSKKTKAKKV